MRIALLGAGRIGQLHGALVASQPDVSVVVADVDGSVPARSQRTSAARRADRPRRRSTWRMPSIVAASTNAHAGLVRQAVDRRLPTFCEKPLAFDLPETVDLVEHNRASGGRRPGRLPAALRPGLCRGPPAGSSPASWGRSTWCGSSPTITSRRRTTYIPVSGGLFRDSSIHDFDALRWVTGVEVEEVYATGLRAGLPRLRALRRRRHRRRHPAAHRWHAGRPGPDAPRPPRLRCPDGDRRVA